MVEPQAQVEADFRHFNPSLVQLGELAVVDGRYFAPVNVA